MVTARTVYRSTRWQKQPCHVRSGAGAGPPGYRFQKLHCEGSSLGRVEPVDDEGVGVMSSSFVIILLWTAALSSGLMAGVYFAFSVFVMKAFAELETTQAIAAMNAINKVILRSLFMPLFFGSTVISVMLIIAAYSQWGDVGAAVALFAGLVYLFGMFICTVVFNVPLNNMLRDLNPHSARAEGAWLHYLKSWTKWNHLRTVSSLISCMLCIWLLFVR